MLCNASVIRNQQSDLLSSLVMLHTTLVVSYSGVFLVASFSCSLRVTKADRGPLY